MANGNGKGIRLSKGVEYTDGNGYTKAAVIIATHNSIQDGTGVERPDKGHAHLEITSPEGKKYVRPNVPLGSGPRTFAVANAEV